MDEKLEEQEERDQVNEELKMPDDLEGSNLSNYDMDQDGFMEGEDAEEGAESDHGDDVENEVFA